MTEKKTEKSRPAPKTPAERRDLNLPPVKVKVKMPDVKPPKGKPKSDGPKE